MSALFLLDYEVESHCCLPDGLDRVEFKHPTSPVTVYIANLSTEPGVDRPLLSMQIVIEAEDAHSAKTEGRRALSQFIDLLSFVTNLKFELHKLLTIVDWTPGKRERRCLAYQPFPGYQLPLPYLSAELVKSVEIFEQADITDQLRRTLRWFARGVRSPYPDDQFQYFWFVVELLAQIAKPVERVSDLCSKCRAPLYCETCKQHPTHRPYPKQAILGLFKQIIVDEPDAFFETASKLRNSLMHGDDVKKIEAEMNIEISDVVDALGRVAADALTRALRSSFKSAPNQEVVPLLRTDSYTHKIFSVAADLIVHGEAELVNLKGYRTIEISMIYDKKKSAADPSTLS